MRRRWFGLLAILMLSSLVLSSCGSKAETAEPDVNPTLPAAYAGKVNPHAGQADAATAGKTLYDTNCASCHGATGKGEGPAGASLDPKPADLTEMSPTDDTDAFIYWRIAEGGAMAPF